MGRKNKRTADYFPHFCHPSKMDSIITNTFGNDGYLVVYMLKEELGLSKNHYMDCRKGHDWAHFRSRTNLDEAKLGEIMNLASEVGFIDEDLWANNVIFSKPFVDDLDVLYERRKTEPPTKEDILQLCGINVDINPQRKEKKSRVKKREEEETSSVKKNIPPEASPEENEFLRKVRENSQINDNLNSNGLNDANITAFYRKISVKYNHNSIIAELDSYINKKLGQYPLKITSNVFTELENWLSKAKPKTDSAKQKTPVQTIEGLLNKDSYLTNREYAKLVLNNMNVRRLSDKDKRILVEIQHIWNFPAEEISTIEILEDEFDKNPESRERYNALLAEVKADFKPFEERIKQIKEDNRNSIRAAP